MSKSLITLKLFTRTQRMGHPLGFAHVSKPPAPFAPPHPQDRPGPCRGKGATAGGNPNSDVFQFGGITFGCAARDNFYLWIGGRGVAAC